MFRGCGSRGRFSGEGSQNRSQRNWNFLPVNPGFSQEMEMSADKGTIGCPRPLLSPLSEKEVVLAGLSLLLEAGTVNPPLLWIRHISCLMHRAGTRQWLGIGTCPGRFLIGLNLPWIFLRQLGVFKALLIVTSIILGYFVSVLWLSSSRSWLLNTEKVISSNWVLGAWGSTCNTIRVFIKQMGQIHVPLRDRWGSEDRILTISIASSSGL